MMKSFGYTWMLAAFSVVMGGCSAVGVTGTSVPASSRCDVVWRTAVPAGEAPAGAIVVSATAERAEIEARACAHGATAILVSPVDKHLAAGRRTFVVLRAAAPARTLAALHADGVALELAPDEVPEVPETFALVDGQVSP